ncbi:MAG: DUF1073 domain-containing protein [Cypionkella sp.]|nr:DUF1073 domain-containing protein [Cypionkella sp.]
MNMRVSLANALASASRRMDVMFPGFFNGAKHNHYADFGFPTDLTFAQFYAMYRRNGLARAGVDRTILKTWQTQPFLAENDNPEETKLEKDIAKRFSGLRLWQRFADADRMGLVGGYAGLILRVADNQRFDQPVNSVTGGLMGLVDIIPAWAGQLTVGDWVNDETNPDYGKPKMFQFNESSLPGQAATGGNRAMTIHPDRVIIISRDGTIHGRSILEPGYNDLITMEKISGAGGEGYWKNAKSAPVLEVDKDANIELMAKAMGIDPSGMADAMNSQVEDWQKGFDKLLMLQGMTATTLGVTLPSPEHFFNIALQSYVASLQMPLKILVGNQTGERASTEDSRDWGQTCMARRVDAVVPSILDFVNRLERFKIIPEREWQVDWADLTESTISDKMDRAQKMNAMSQGLDPVFAIDEIREAAGYPPLNEIDVDEDEGDDQ